jgi:hypothetical protein
LKRLEFVSKWLEGANNKIGVVIWSDETMVRSPYPFTRTQSCYVHKDKKISYAEKHHTGKFSVMFWGCFSELGRGTMVVLKGKAENKSDKSSITSILVGTSVFGFELIELVCFCLPFSIVFLYLSYLAVPK